MREAVILANKWLLRLYPCFYSWQQLVAFVLHDIFLWVIGKMKSVIHNIYRRLITMYTSHREVDTKRVACEESHNG